MTEDYRAREPKAIRVARRRAEDVRCRLAGARRVPEVLQVTAPLGPEPAAVAYEATAPFDAEVVRRYGRVAVVAVSGEIDLRTSPVLRERLGRLAGEGVDRLVVDLAGVRFCDASGLGALVAAHNRLSGLGGEIRLARVRPAQRRLLAVTGLDRLFPLHGTIEEATGEGRAPTAATLD